MLIQFWEFQVSLQQRREQKMQEGKIDALTDEVSVASPRPTISDRSQRIAANQPDLASGAPSQDLY